MDLYAVMTWGEKMPSTFPIETAQNSGNMVHAQAPFKMFPNSVGMDYGYQAEGYASFADFVNDRCEAVIIPFANTLRTDPAHDERGFSVAKSLDQFRVPIIPFGLGAQAPNSDIDAVDLGPGMIELVRKLSDSTPAVSVRGEFTYEIFKKYGSVDNVHVTGCPSFFSHPEAFQALRSRLHGNPSYDRLSFAGSLHHLKESKEQLYRAIRQDLYLVEPVNAKLHQFYIDCLAVGDTADLPYFLKGFLADPEWNTSRLAEFMVKRYRLFRDLTSWIAFNRESTDGATGTRFHVNMASLISGLPAVWVVHDSRTAELCDRLSLPNVSMEETLSKPYRQIMQEADYGPMFRALGSNFEEFNVFLAAADLPSIKLPDGI